MNFAPKFNCPICSTKQNKKYNTKTEQTSLITQINPNKMPQNSQRQRTELKNGKKQIDKKK